MAQIPQIFPARRQWDDAIDDVSKAPPDAVSIRLVAGARGLEKLSSFKNLESLWCFAIDRPALDAICNCVSLESLYIEKIKTGDLGALQRLPNLRTLGLETCSRASSLSDLAKLTPLQGLAITHFKNVHDLEPLASLHGLRALAVAGSMWTALRVASFQPLGALQDLEYLHLTNIKSGDGSLKPLARLTRLRKLEIANFYSMSEFAWLARRLPSTECQWFKPYVDVVSIRCKKCGGASMAMPSGKRVPIMCRQCDAQRLEKHMRDWDASAQE